ncbi:restriction endonuclease [Crocosphaera sp. UHCC 0190]|uniref:restriction endonuclease n=1 Tax=Crocosphaera sp. UHCC 0190 TaxID=3110246 RepID=UPI002B2198FA|nr:restriction endonuclease [Crocosphaera sp. UHCC 0190]MEA5511820.1 restriction endonuclease [Crocosphaera sp. UHCC 0190]
MKNISSSTKEKKILRILIYFLLICSGFIISLSKGLEIFLAIIIIVIVDLIRNSYIERERKQLHQEILEKERKLQQEDNSLQQEIYQRKQGLEISYHRKKKTLEEELNRKKKTLEEELNRKKKTLEEELNRKKKTLEEELNRKKKTLEEELNRKKKTLEEELNRKKKTLEEELNRKKKTLEEELNQKEVAVEQLLKEKSLGFPSLAEAYADYFYLKDLQEADFLEKKTNPAKKAAEAIREIAKQRKAAEKKCRILEYQVKYYKNLIPELEDLEEEGTSGTLEAEIDDSKYIENPERRWLSEDEFNNLSSIEKSQLVLDRYWKHKKTKWELGRDYERYVGYQYENKGCKVHYQGILEGFDDLGRDLIVINPDKSTTLVQCKYWSRAKIIHEKHIFQLFGTFTAYKIDHPNINVSAIFVTSTSLSERAKQFAKVLGIQFVESYKMEKYPCIKCNISAKEKIYHLPFDQQYDKVIIEPEKGEFYAWTVREAEEKGFRRAKKWLGSLRLEQK